MEQKPSYHMLLGSSVSRLGKTKMGRRSRENLKWVECRLGHSHAVSLMEEVHPKWSLGLFPSRAEQHLPPPQSPLAYSVRSVQSFPGSGRDQLWTSGLKMEGESLTKP